MRVFLTGATGFLGAHIALELLRAGHQLRLLVRNERAARDYFASHGFELDDVVVADMLDKAQVAQALAGCDAVLHAAAMVSLDSKRADEVYRTNVGGLASVVGPAIEAGIGNIVYVSSFTVLFQPGAKVIDETTPLCDFKDAYARSKRDCELWVRERQAAGAPIQVSYPSGVYGPDDPGLSESNRALVSFARGAVLNTSSGTMCVDVRDLARMHLWLLENPASGDHESRRFVMGGHYFSWPAFKDQLQGLVAKPIKSPAVPGWVMRGIGRTLDFVRRFRPVDTPLTAEAMAIMTQCSPANSGRIISASGLGFRPAEETLGDTLQWMVKAGHLKPHYLKQPAQPGLR